MVSEDSRDSNMIGNKTFMSGDSNSRGIVIAAGMTGVEMRTDAKPDPRSF